MADRLFLKPADPKAIVRHPPPLLDRVLPPEGEHVADRPYWRRRILAEDVVSTRPPRVAKKKEA